MQKSNRNSAAQGSLVSRLIYLLRGIPVTREQLFDVLRSARKRELLDDDALPMIQRVMQVSDLQVDHVMVARAQMVTIDSNQTIDEALPIIRNTFPIREYRPGDRAAWDEHYQRFREVCA